MNNDPSEGIGVTEVKHPGKDELELIYHVYVPYTFTKWYVSNPDMIHHPDAPHLEGYAPGYYVLFYSESELYDLRAENESDK